MRVIITGSRKWKDRERIASCLFDLPVTTTIVHGGAGGADSIAAQEAEKLGLIVEPHRAKWQEHDREGAGLVRCFCSENANHCKMAGFRRNEEMAALGAVLCISFWDGMSKGTIDCEERCAKHGIPIESHHQDFPNRPQRERPVFN